MKHNILNEVNEIRQMMGLINEQSSTNEPENKTPKIINKVVSEGIKNVLPEMINSEPFKGYYGGTEFGGEFKGKLYIWDCEGLEGMMSSRSTQEGEIITEYIEVFNEGFDKNGMKKITDFKPNMPAVGIYKLLGGRHGFIIYTSNQNKVKFYGFSL